MTEIIFLHFFMHTFSVQEIEQVSADKGWKQADKKRTNGLAENRYNVI